MLRGVEPNVRWQSFCRAVVSVAEETGCEMVVTLGALLGDVPHTRGVRVTGTASDPELINGLELAAFAVRGTHRHRRRAARRVPGERPALGIAVGARSALRRRRRPTRPPRARCSSASAQLAELDLDLHGLDQLVDLWRVQVDHAIRDNDEVSSYVRELEGRVDAEDADDRGIVLGGHPAGGGSVPDAEELAAEVEQFLREQDGGS